MEFAKRFDGITGSAIRDIFKMLAVPGMISFAGGNPSSAALQNEEIAKISYDVLMREGKAILQYGATEGWPELRNQISLFLKAFIGISAKPEEILPTTGSTQAIDLLLKATINEGDVILVEDPSFLGTLQAMHLYGAKLIGVPMDSEGMRMDELERLIKEYRPKLLYTVATFQNPTGCTLSLQRRYKLAELAEQYGVIIAEDDPYRELRYSGESLPTIYSLGSHANIIYFTSFSKLISPGLRVGAAITKDPQLMRKMVIGKQSSDTHSANLSQAIVTEYLKRDLLHDHIKDICSRYREQLNTMIDGFGHFPDGIKVFKPDGGLFVWAELPESIDCRELLKRAVEKKVAFVPGTHFYADGGHYNTIRLNFSNSEPSKIIEGMEILNKVIREER